MVFSLKSHWGILIQEDLTWCVRVLLIFRLAPAYMRGHVCIYIANGTPFTRREQIVLFDWLPSNRASNAFSSRCHCLRPHTLPSSNAIVQENLANGWSMARAESEPKESRFLEWLHPHFRGCHGLLLRASRRSWIGVCVCVCLLTGQKCGSFVVSTRNGKE